ncbi:hypothetical protein CVT26_001229 [Gymnopilus dilepis]|uniref:Uncharacterized protein n=1 Tax=Gymnopilus dilepis TaxID=231916 RepID=A0A409WEH2_9AGAR|nr:hypothetical protein CVT26_001229 [Gymnopilus dilepis]
MASRDCDMPLVDENNPFYCPAVPATLYLESLRMKTNNLDFHRSHLSDYPARALGDSAKAHGGSDFDSSDWVLRELFVGRGWFSGQHPPTDDLPPYSPPGPVRGQLESLGPVQNVVESTTLSSKSDFALKEAFSDFDAPPKYARSLLSCHDSSFDLEVHHERLRFDTLATSSPSLKKQVKTSDTGVDNLGLLIHKLDSALPGMRLRDRLWELNPTNAQILLEFLCEQGVLRAYRHSEIDLDTFIDESGYINEKVLLIFSDTQVECIAFSQSMSYENGLNVSGSEVYSVLNRPDTFLFLTEVSFAGVRLRDSDLRYLSHLRKLSVLNLSETGIGNEAVYLLVSLKQTLKLLYLAINPDINDDAVPAILLLSNLTFLSILDTGIEMAGLRRLAEAMHEYNWVLDVEIPFVCETYVDCIHTQYLCHPRPPLITNPYICAQLSNAALVRNLEAHAACNSSIIASGSRAEMIERLSKILLIRKLDMLVVGMLQGNDQMHED